MASLKSVPTKLESTIFFGNSPIMESLKAMVGPSASELDDAAAISALEAAALSVDAESFAPLPSPWVSSSGRP